LYIIRVASRRETFTTAMILIRNIRTGLKVCVMREKSAIHSRPIDERVSSSIRRHLHQNRRLALFQRGEAALRKEMRVRGEARGGDGKLRCGEGQGSGSPFIGWRRERRSLQGGGGARSGH
jgi:hypothetical protein